MKEYPVKFGVEGMVSVQPHEGEQDACMVFYMEYKLVSGKFDEKIGNGLPEIDMSVQSHVIKIDKENKKELIGRDTISELIYGAGHNSEYKEDAETTNGLFFAIIEASIRIYRKTLRGHGNFYALSLNTSRLLNNNVDFGVNQIVSEHVPDNIILVGYRGNSFMDCGYVISPLASEQKYSIKYGAGFVPGGENFYEVINIVR